ncbi:MAG: M42 family metallopeptidase [Chloroflexi bacterium]|nr:M42 family metallopeptidase [Chloroflexota bacterium]
MDLQEHLITLSEAPGVSGHEGPIREAIHAAWEGLADDLTVDRLGTLLATRHGTGPDPRPKVLVTAHMDEIGLMVTDIEGDFLRVTSVGGIDKRVLISQPVIVHGQRPLRGLIGSRPPHVLTQEDRKKYPKISDLVVDTGLPHDDLRELVHVGDLITFDQPALPLSDGLVSGKSMDNRASCAAMTAVLHALGTRSHRWDVLVAATVQEEVTLGGGQTIAWRTQPDLAIVVDTGWAIGVGVDENKGYKLGGGPTIIIGPNAHPRLYDQITDLAKELEIDLHPEPMPRSSGTEAWAIQVSRDGVPTAILSIPIRNMHSPVEIVALKDIERTARLIVEFVTRLDDSTLESLALDAATP